MRERSTHARVTWHDLECGGFAADLALWDEIAARSEGPVLDLGCGAGRVALDLARRGHTVSALDRDPVLIDALRARARDASLEVEPFVADATDFDLGLLLSPEGSPEAPGGFGTVLAPMQLLQLFAGADERVACMRRARAHLRPGGLMAAAIVDGLPEELVEEAPSPLPDTREIDGWVYSSLPLDAGLENGAIVVRRLRQTVSPAGELSEEVDEIPLLVVDAGTIEAEARRAGLHPLERLDIPPTDAHVGSTVLVLENRP